MAGSGLKQSVLQIHPTRRCNLECLHCYSSSGPREDEEIDLQVLLTALEDARVEGYEILSVSGGEPLLYKSLGGLLVAARRLGMKTTVTSNGMLLSGQRLDAIEGLVDLLAISLDGQPESHNRMRGSPRAFDAMARNLPALRDRHWRFGFIFTLTQHNLNELAWVYDFAVEQGASLLQIHPLELAGRAREQLEGSRPDGLEATYAFLEWIRLQKAAGNRMLVHLDLADRRVTATEPSRFVPTASSGDLLAQIVSPLVVEADGTVVPLLHGLARKFALGNLHDHRLRDLVAHWRIDGHERFRNLCIESRTAARSTDGLPFFNWYEVVAETAERAHVNGSSPRMRPTQTT